jgi:hypothetical protein
LATSSETVASVVHRSPSAPSGSAWAQIDAGRPGIGGDAGESDVHQLPDRGPALDRGGCQGHDHVLRQLHGELHHRHLDPDGHIVDIEAGGFTVAFSENAGTRFFTDNGGTLTLGGLTLQGGAVVGA